MFEVSIRSDVVLDGTAAPAFPADVGLSSGRVAVGSQAGARHDGEPRRRPPRPG